MNLVSAVREFRAFRTRHEVSVEANRVLLLLNAPVAAAACSVHNESVAVEIVDLSSKVCMFLRVVFGRSSGILRSRKSGVQYRGKQ